jgi:uncharacterized protein YkwD
MQRTRLVTAVAALVCALLSVAAVQAPGAQAGSGTHIAVDSLEADVLVEINALRRSHGLAPLRTSLRLRAAADMHSAAMARGGFFQHESADGSAFWKRIQRSYSGAGYRTWSVGENLLWASPSIDAKTALQMWLDSPSHRKILLTPRWREIGLSAVQAPAAGGYFGGLDVTILTADFGVRR